MSLAVHKYELQPGVPEVAIPSPAKLLHVDVIDSRVYVWALVDPADGLSPRRIGFIGTGLPIPADCEYVGTAVDRRTNLVWHVFEEATS